MTATDRPSQIWPNNLAKPDPARVQTLLEHFWERLVDLPALLLRGEQLLAAELTHDLRAVVLEMMLALNGIQRPGDSAHLNSYLSDRQRAALERTLIAPAADGDSWLGQAVALVVIYRWYAPQLVDQFALDYPHAAEAQAWATLRNNLPDWPAHITSE